MKSKQNYKSRFRILKGGKISLVISSLLTSITISFAAPSGGTVISGTANISNAGDITTISQSTSKASINWQNFSIAEHETVNFVQPDINSITLNKVIGNESSIINGALNATGQVWILNSNGVLFGKNASINTAGLLASTKDLSLSDFNSGNYNFKGTSSASVINLGSIDISDSGYSVFLANLVTNEGSINVVKGKVHLTGASDVTINLNGNSLVNLTVNKGVLDAYVQNKGAIYAGAGEIYLTTNTVDELLKGVVNNTGILEANSLDGITGKIEMFAHEGEVEIGGSISALDGFIETSGETFTMLEDVEIKADTWLLDPADVTIESSGSTSDLEASSVSASFIESTLNSGTDVEIEATNSITINDDITWDDSQLYLNATDEANDININATLTATDDAELKITGNLLVGLEESGFTGKIDLDIDDIEINGAEYTVINNLGLEGSTTTTDLQGINGDLSGNYVLGSNIDASTTVNWNSYPGRYGFDPLGNSTTEFTGNFDGLGHTVSDLTIYKASQNYVGLFGKTNASSIKNIGITNADIKGEYSVGGLVGYNNYSTISNSYATGTVSGNDDVGGLVGTNDSSDISNSYATGTVSGDANKVGGLVGSNYSYSTISNSYATGTVSGNNYVGGLVGYNYSNSTISNSYATGTVSGDDDVGGLVGQNYSYSTISNSYATGAVSGDDDVGGLVGRNNDESTISNSYATGAVSGDEDVGGLVGQNYSYSTISNSYATGAVSGDDDVGGLVGRNNDESTISNSYATGTVSGTSYNVGGLVGRNYNDSTISNSYATGLVSGDSYTGGLVGYNDSNSTISNSYASGTVSGTNEIGGLVGLNYRSTISNSYATGIVSGNADIGGLVGYNDANSTISNSYASGKVSGNRKVGGLVGDNVAIITDSYYDKTINSSMDDEALYGKTTSELQTASTFSSWDMSSDSIDGFYPTLMADGSLNTWEIIFKETTKSTQSKEEIKTKVKNLIASLSSSFTPDIVLPSTTSTASSPVQRPNTSQNTSIKARQGSPSSTGEPDIFIAGTPVVVTGRGASLPSSDSKKEEEGNI